MSDFLAAHLYRIGKFFQRLRVSIQTVRNGIYSGKIKPLKTGRGEHKIPENEIRRILEISNKERKTIVYSRVSSQGQKSENSFSKIYLKKIRENYSYYSFF